MKKWMTIVVLIAALALLAGCGRGSDDEQTETGTSEVVAQDSQDGGQDGAGQERAGPGQAGRGGQDYGSQFLTNDYEGALTPMIQLVVGGLQLEGTESAITPEQAGKLLPFWQGIAGGAITNGEERNAVLKQIEATMTETQMQAIVDMQLTFEDVEAWAEANGIEIPQFGGGEGGAGGPGGRGGAFAALTDDQRQELQDLSPEERVAKLREFGIEVPEGGFGGGRQGGGGQGGGGQGGPGADRGQRNPGGRFGAVMQPLVELLEARASE